MFTSKLKITYFQLKDGYKVSNDKYGIASYESDARRECYLANPNLIDYSKTYLYLGLVDDIPVGRSFYFPAKMKFGDECGMVLSGSALNVHPDYRDLAIGADIIMNTTFNDEYPQTLAAGISPMALPLFKKMRYHIFEIPKYLLRNNTAVFFQRFGLRGLLLKCFSNLLNPIFRLRKTLFCRTNKLESKFTVKNLQDVPEWVDDMVLNDGHRYMEVHDHKWLQWNLDYSCKVGGRNEQAFYGVYFKDEPVGFFMIKEREIDEQHNVIYGSVVEWGNSSDKILSEESICKMAIKAFSKDVSFIEIGTLNVDVAKRLEKCGFFRNGEEHIVFKNNTDKYKDIKDASLWRLRLGYADTILS
jgi:hypothetical protein